jgi:chemotaxis protein MotA
MFAFIGIVIGVACTLLGYIMHGGNIAVLIQPTEIIIIVGAGVGIFIGSNGMGMVGQTIKAVTGLLKPLPNKQTYIDTLKMMYQLFTIARKEGLLGLEKHVETPEESEIIKKFPGFLANHHAVHFFCDTTKVILTGAVGPHDLAEMMELDLEVAHEEEMRPVEAMQNVADAMPAVGIVAAVLGVIITMGKIGGAAETIGHSVAAALVGTFMGIFIGYVMISPLAKSISNRIRAEGQLLNCVRFALFSFARGESPITCVEFARRNIDPSVRPGFQELDTAVKEKDAAQAA